MLSLTNLQVYYDRAVEAVRDVSLEVGAGRIVALLGSNGAGKSTVLKAICGVLYPEEGEVTGGSIRYADQSLQACRPHEIVRRGIVQVPEGRRLFPKLSVEENLLLGAFREAARPQIARNLAFAFEAFPVLGAQVVDRLSLGFQSKDLRTEDALADELKVDFVGDHDLNPFTVCGFRLGDWGLRV